MEPVKISSLELENVKRIRAVQIVPTKDGLTVIGGRNEQGKTSVLDAIAWALGGNKMKPDNPNRDGAAMPAKLHVELSNGIVVERRGKNGTLHVTDQTGMRGTQKLLDEFLSQLALDLPRFLDGTDKQRTDALLQTLGIDRQLAALDGKIRSTFERRTLLGREAKSKRAHAAELPYHDDAPDEPLLVGELSAKLMEAHNINRTNQQKRDKAFHLKSDHDAMRDEIDHLRQSLEQMEAAYDDEEKKLSAALKEAMSCEDIDTSEIEESINAIENINACVADNQRKAEATEEAERAQAEYDAASAEIETLRGARTALLDGAPLPLEGLSVDEGGTLTFMGQTWGDMSGSQRLRVATAIVRATKPECGFVLVDKLEQFDTQQLADFATWAQGEGLQVIGTRVSTGDECTVVIEDGRVEGQDMPEPTPPDPRGEAISWGGDEF